MTVSGATPPDATPTTPDPIGELPGQMFAVLWRRQDWPPERSCNRRTYETYAGAERFADRLRAGRSDLSPVTVVVIERRPVGAWQPVDLERAS